MAEGSLSKAKPMLNDMSKNTQDQLSVAFRLKKLSLIILLKIQKVIWVK